MVRSASEKIQTTKKPETFYINTITNNYYQVKKAGAQVAQKGTKQLKLTNEPYQHQSTLGDQDFTSQSKMSVNKKRNNIHQSSRGQVEKFSALP